MGYQYAKTDIWASMLSSMRQRQAMRLRAKIAVLREEIKEHRRHIIENIPDTPLWRAHFDAHNEKTLRLAEFQKQLKSF